MDRLTAVIGFAFHCNPLSSFSRVVLSTLVFAGFNATNRSSDHTIHRCERETSFVSARNRRKPNRRGLGIAGEDSLKQSGQLLARWTVGHLVPMAHYLPRIEHIHVNMYVDFIGKSTKSIELSENCRRHVPQFVNAELLNG